MTNDELKKKILTIVRGAMLEADELPFIETTDNIADALIAAGIGDVETVQKIAASTTTMAVLEAAKAAHRAEVVEKIARKACDMVFSEEVEDGTLTDKLLAYKQKNGIKRVGFSPTLFYDYLKEQAEKELAEEEKDD